MRYDPPMIRCRACFGSGRVERARLQSFSACVLHPTADEADVVETEIAPCDACEGRGRRPATIPARVKVYQHGRLVGTMPSVIPKLDGNPLVDPVLCIKRTSGLSAAGAHIL